MAIFSPNSTWYPVAVHANLSAGVTSVTLSPAYGAEELVHPLWDSRPEYIFVAPGLEGVVREGMKRVGGFAARNVVGDAQRAKY